MSKKQLNNRLNDLFASLENRIEPEISSEYPVGAIGTSMATISTVSTPDEVKLAGWTWSAGPDGRYLDVGPEVTGALGYNLDRFEGQLIAEYLLDISSQSIMKTTLQSGITPAEVPLSILHANGEWLAARCCILSSSPNGWHGVFQLIPTNGSLPVPQVNSDPAPIRPRFNERNTRPRVSTDRKNQPAKTGKSATKKTNPLPGHVIAQPGAITVPIQAAGLGDMTLEVFDDESQRNWTEEERQMVMDVASQLSLALENARLFQAAQQELAERVRAEEVILHRNRDLATLNRIGQRLTGQISRNEIFETLAEMVGQVLDDRNLFISMIDRARTVVNYPVCRVNGMPVNMPDRPFGKGLPEHIALTRLPLLLSKDVGLNLVKLDIHPGDRTPKSLLAIPILVGSHQTGALVIQDFDQETAPQFDDVHLELLSTAVSQAATAIENANLFQQMQDALKAIETRERYQAGVARAAASLSEFGTQSLGEVLRFIGQAAQASRAYFLVFQEENQTWRLGEDWTSPLVAYLFDRSKIHSVPMATFAPLLGNLRTDGWVLPISEGFGEKVAEFFKQQNIRTALILAVSGKSSAPNLLILEQIDQPRAWHQDEINLLRVAADAIANTFVREDLLVQLRANLDETESLYNASNRLAVANDFQEMLSAVINGVKPAGINRGVMLIFDTDAHKKISAITVRGNWYSGHGTPPPALGTVLPRVIYERQLQSSTQSFFEDIKDALIDETMRQALLQQNVVSLGMLPMWSGKRQVGILLLESEQRHNFTSKEKRLLSPLVDQLTIAVENLRLFEQTQEALSETALLYNMTSGIAQAQSPDDMAALVANNVLPGGTDLISMWVNSSDEDASAVEWEITGYLDTTGESNRKGQRINAQDLPILNILPEEGLSIQDMGDPLLDEVSRRTLEPFGMRSVCIVPLRSGGRMVGALMASSRKTVQFDVSEVRLFRTVANGIAVAVEKQRLLRQAQRRALELQTASEIARDTTSTLTLDDLLSRMVTLLVKRFGYYHTSIFLIDETGQQAVISESSGPAGKELKHRAFRLAVGSRSVIGTVTASGKPVIINDTTTSDLYYPNPLLPETRSEIGLPLKLGDRVIGALDIHATTANAFTNDEVFVLSILTDQISIAIENARAYELSQRAIEDMKEVDRVKSQFLANMSHELRTPLNSIIGFSRVILKGIDGPINDVQQQDLSAIYSSGQHLLSLINNILDLSKIEAGKMELSFSDLNLADLINSAMPTAAGLVKGKPIKLKTILPDDLPLVRADNIRISQVLINFLSNAVKFTDEGTITVEARTNTAPNGTPEVMVLVTDSGPGIAPEDQSKLFLPFSQVDDSPTRKTGGTGLGLSICRSLIDMHNGRIGLYASEVGKGSTFFFSLPLPANELRIFENVPGDGNIILSIDDDLQVISLYERYLKPQGYQVIAHTNPRTAVQAAKELHPFAITLDVMMPEVDGWQVMRALKNDPETRDIPVVVCSILEEEEKGYTLGAADYLVKPFISDDLLNALNRLNSDDEIGDVLVIDDDEEDLRLVQKMLEESHRYHIHTARGGQAGLDFLKQMRPDVIILDLFMPDINGFDVLGELQSQKLLQNIPVIILTGADLTPEQHRKLTASGQDFLAKGFLRQTELLNSLETALRQFRQPR